MSVVKPSRAECETPQVRWCRNFWRAAAERALRTAGQVLTVLVGVDMATAAANPADLQALQRLYESLTTMNWPQTLGAVAFAAALSLGTSIYANLRGHQGPSLLGTVEHVTPYEPKRSAD